MQNSFDVQMVRDFHERQRQDSEKIVALCDSLTNLFQENQKLKQELEAETKASPQASNPDNGK